MQSKATPVGRILIRNARLAFPNLFEATTVGGEGKPSFSASLIIPSDHAQVAEIRQKLSLIHI